MSIFPFLDGIISGASNNVTELPLYKEIAWDYDNDKPIVVNGNFKIVEGAEAVKVWCYVALRTKRFKHIIFSWNYGNEIESLIGKGNHVNLIKSQVIRFVREALIANPYIISIPFINLDTSNDMLKIFVKINTVYGETEVNVNV